MNPRGCAPAQDRAGCLLGGAHSKLVSASAVRAPTFYDQSDIVGVDLLELATSETNQDSWRGGTPISTPPSGI